MMSSEPTNFIKELSAPFDVSEVQQRKGKGGKVFDYVPWTSVVARLNEVLEEKWDWVLDNVSLTVRPKDDEVEYLAWVSGILRIRSEYHATTITRSGVGAATSSDDPDMAIKTAQAEALKKAANQYGVALELWDEDHRDKLEQERNAGSIILKKYQEKIREYYVIDTKDEAPTVAKVAEYYRVEPADLSNVDVLAEIVETIIDA